MFAWVAGFLNYVTRASPIYEPYGYLRNYNEMVAEHNRRQAMSDRERNQGALLGQTRVVEGPVHSTDQANVSEIGRVFDSVRDFKSHMDKRLELEQKNNNELRNEITDTYVLLQEVAKILYDKNIIRPLAPVVESNSSMCKRLIKQLSGLPVHGPHITLSDPRTWPRVGTQWKHTNGNIYRVKLYTNTESNRQDEYPTTVIYENVYTGDMYSRKLVDWERSMSLLSV